MTTTCPPPTGSDRAAPFAEDTDRYDPRSGSFSDLVRGLIDDARMLFRQEARLARAEMAQKAAKAGRQSVSILIGGGVALAGAIALVGALCTGLWALLLAAGLSHAVAVWLAPLVVGAVLLLIGYGLIQKGISTLRAMSAVPEKTTESLKETGQWLHAKVS